MVRSGCLLSDTVNGERSLERGMTILSSLLVLMGSRVV